MDEMSFIDRIFELLNSNKKFPAYQAERRIDIFINYFLEGILEDVVNHDEDKKRFAVEFVAPEFPLIKDIGNQSTNVDYLCLAKDRNSINQLLFVELKTDAESFDVDQCQTYLEYECGNKTWGSCINGIKKIAASKGMPFYARKKYFHLFESLDGSKSIKCDQKYFEDINIILDAIDKETVGNNRKLKLEFTSIFKKLIDSTKVSNGQLPIRLIYLSPIDIVEKVKKKCKKAKVSAIHDWPKKLGKKCSAERKAWQNMTSMIKMVSIEIKKKD